MTQLIRLCVLTTVLAGNLILNVGQPALSQDAADPPLQWWKGNLHTHSLWSDGDEFPEMIAAWYLERGYNFLALSDHNVLSRGQRWMPLTEIVRRADEGILDRYRARFGTAWVETRGDSDADDFSVRLKPLDEFRHLVEQSGQFIMIQSEEISDSAEGKPVHMNAANLAQPIEPAGGPTVRDAIRNNLRLVLEQERETGRSMLPHLNHPNFGYAVTADDLAAVVQEQFFEVYNGHPSVNQLGDSEHPSIEKMWDIVNALRLGRYDGPPLLGIAVDDSHEYHGRPGSRPGRGWIMVRSRYLTPEHLINAIKAGDFYASSGVLLEDIEFDADTRTLSLVIADQEDATYVTEFIASLRADGSDSLADTGVVMSRVEGRRPSYSLRGDELYVRALVTSSRAPADPSYADQKQQAWTQPVGF